MIVDPDPLVKEVEWGEGPFGLLLTPDRDPANPPRVTRITHHDAATARANVAAGDTFVSINGLSTAVLGYIRVLQMLKHDPRPMKLRFRARDAQAFAESLLATPNVPVSVQPPPEETYTFEWSGGPLGMVFRPHADNFNRVCIGRITREVSGLERAAEGDMLVAVNGQSTAALGFDDIMNTVVGADKPVTLLFQSMRAAVN